MFMCSDKANLMPYLVRGDYIVCYRIEYEFWVLGWEHGLPGEVGRHS
jgi:hypothetical protein